MWTHWWRTWCSAWSTLAPLIWHWPTTRTSATSKPASIGSGNSSCSGWYGDHIQVQDKKELLRCVIEQVRLATKGKVVRAEVVWHGGARSELDVPKYMGASTAAYHRVIVLAQTHTDAEIAEQLNAEELRTMKGKPWTARRVMDFRVSNAIPSGLTASPTMRLPETDYLTSTQAAERLGVDQSRIQTWFRWGVLSGKQDAAQRQLWIAWNADVAPSKCCAPSRASCPTRC